MELTENGFIKTCEFLFRKADVYKSMPLKWDVKRNILKRKDKMGFMYFRFSYAVCYCLIATFQVYQSWHHSDLFVKTYGIFGLGGFSWAMPCYTITMFQGPRIAALLNAMVQFERREVARVKGNKGVKPEWIHNPSRGWKLYTKFIKIMCMLMGLANNWCFVFHSNALAQPCFSINLFYHLSATCAKHGLGFFDETIATTAREWAIRIWIVATGLTMWLSMSSAAMCLSALLTIKGHCIACYIKYYERVVFNAKPTNKNLWQNILLFRQIQAILVEFRTLYSWRVFVPAIFGGIFLQVTTAFLVADTVRSGHATDRWPIVYFGVYGFVVLALVSIFLYTTQGRVYLASVQAQQEIQRRKRQMLNRRFKRYFASCPILKVHFGDYNFFEPSTALVMEDLVLDNTISLLML